MAAMKPAFSVKAKRSAAGLGLYAEEKIPRRARIIEYFGEVIPDAEADIRLGKYLFELGNGNTIDGTTRQNVARYINHSCKPNCEAILDGKRVFINAMRAIEPGDELSYDYGKDYFKQMVRENGGCRCGHHHKTK